jgi:hypothetical protein
VVRFLSKEYVYVRPSIAHHSFRLPSGRVDLYAAVTGGNPSPLQRAPEHARCTRLLRYLVESQSIHDNARTAARTPSSHTRYKIVLHVTNEVKVELQVVLDKPHVPLGSHVFCSSGLAQHQSGLAHECSKSMADFSSDKD